MYIIDQPNKNYADTNAVDTIAAFPVTEGTISAGDGLFSTTRNLRGNYFACYQHLNCFLSCCRA